MDSLRRARIAVLDEDHVMGLTRIVLTAPRAEAEDKLRAFFAPEACDLAPVWQAAGDLTAGRDLDVVLCKRPEDAADAQIILFRRGAVPAGMMAANPTLRLIQRWGERSDMIDLETAAARGVHVSCLARPSLHFVAEHVLLLMMALAKKLVASERAVRRPAGEAGKDGDSRYNWPGIPGAGGLYAHVLGIIGVGEIGTLLARRAKALGMRVLYSNRRRLPAAEEAALGLEYRTLDQLLAAADFVSLHATNVAENEKLINAERLARMKRSAFFINTGRGRFVDEDALYDALRSGALAGAGLDVHRREPRPRDDRFFNLDNVILTPHLAGGSRLETRQEIIAALENFRAVLDGRPPPHNRVA